jgi:hypothetical protein
MAPLSITDLVAKQKEEKEAASKVGHPRLIVNHISEGSEGRS